MPVDLAHQEPERAQFFRQWLERHERELMAYASDALCAIDGLRQIGTAREKAGVLSFVVDGFRSEDIGAVLDRDGIAVRSGHHCAQPALRRFGVETTVRPSLGVYNTRGDIDALIASLRTLTRTHAQSRREYSSAKSTSVDTTAKTWLRDRDERSLEALQRRLIARR